ncbi:hypothetical protein X769_24480 [Mesorhizobium sp. LSJC268A00]|uniref:AAA family ATPase n=1 Tax=unclassified Mesorhizobium TaxID=325217 RepID=UPI0003CE86DE|nr:MULTISPECIES: AAA family ATPase [unclassified Mesorhizobium]ESW99303.1 hypothetical protein X769_24480 [Mesorhizobium sp. LSJC268A00]
MAAIIAVAGLAGTGKSTAVEYLSKHCGGEIVYLGKFVLKRVQEKGLERTRDNETIARTELRKEAGPAALVVKAQSEICNLLESGVSVCVDAVFLNEEMEQLEIYASGRPTYLVALEAEHDVRRSRLIQRADRPFVPQEIANRDKFETVNLHMEGVIAKASIRISNNGTMDEFREKLRGFLVEITAAK